MSDKIINIDSLKYYNDKINQRKQDVLISGQNIRTINGESIVGGGNIEIRGGNPDANVSAIDTSETLDDVSGNTYVKYVAQTLTDEQKAQVRSNINALSQNNIKTINGESIVGSGDITISGGSSSGSSVYSEVSHGTADTTFSLTPNTFHIWDEVSSLTLTLGAETIGVANEYLFQFTSGSEPTTLSLPDDIKWTGGETPTIEANKIYQISVLKGLGSVLEWEYGSAIGTFTINFGMSGTIDFNFDKGMTWQDFVDSEYNTDSAIRIYNSIVIYNDYVIKNVSPTDAIINMNIYSATYVD